MKAKKKANLAFMQCCNLIRISSVRGVIKSRSDYTVIRYKLWKALQQPHDTKKQEDETSGSCVGGLFQKFSVWPRSKIPAVRKC